MVAHDGGGTDFGAAFDEDLRGDLERFAQLDTGGETAGFLVRRHVHDGDASELRRVCDGNGLRGDLTVGDGGAVAAFVVLEARGVLAVVRLRGEVVRDVDCLPDEVRRVADFASVLSSECDVADRDELLLSADAPFFSSAIPPIVYG